MLWKHYVQWKGNFALMTISVIEISMYLICCQKLMKMFVVTDRCPYWWSSCSFWLGLHTPWCVSGLHLGIPRLFLLPWPSLLHSLPSPPPFTTPAFMSLQTKSECFCSTLLGYQLYTQSFIHSFIHFPPLIPLACELLWIRSTNVLFQLFSVPHCANKSPLIAIAGH